MLKLKFAFLVMAFYASPSWAVLCQFQETQTYNGRQHKNCQLPTQTEAEVYVYANQVSRLYVTGGVKDKCHILATQIKCDDFTADFVENYPAVGYPIECYDLSKAKGYEADNFGFSSAQRNTACSDAYHNALKASEKGDWNQFAVRPHVRDPNTIATFRQGIVGAPAPALAPEAERERP